MKNVSKMKWSLVVLLLVFVFGLLSSKFKLKENGEVGSKILLAVSSEHKALGTLGTGMTTPFYGVLSVDGICGVANGVTYHNRPNNGLCRYGVVVWKDKTGSDGYFNWKCKGIAGGSSVSCYARKAK